MVYSTNWKSETPNRMHLYRPPTTSKYYSESVNDEINRLIMRAAQLVNEGKYDNLLIVGDFNYPKIYWDNDGGMLKSSD